MNDAIKNIFLKLLTSVILSGLTLAGKWLVDHGADPSVLASLQGQATYIAGIAVIALVPVYSAVKAWLKSRKAAIAAPAVPPKVG